MFKYKMMSIVLFVLFFVPRQYINAQTITDITKEYGYVVPNEHNPKSMIVIDAEKGRILFSENEEQVMDIASITKLMSMYVVFEAINDNKITLNTQVVATTTDEAISQIKELSNTTIISGQSYSVENLIKMSLLPSSNVAIIMLANLVSHNQLNEFVLQMNNKAKTFGMTQTTFTHPTGAKASLFQGLANVSGISNQSDNISSAKDVAILAYHLLRDFPQIINYTKLANDTLPTETITNTNYSIPGLQRGLEGVDGLKTGSSATSGYSYAFTMMKNNYRIIGVILGVGQYGDESAKINKHAFGNAIALKTYDTYKLETIINNHHYIVDNVEVRVNEPFVNLVGGNQNWQYKFENNHLVVNESLRSVIKPTQYIITVDNITKAKEDERNQKIIIILSGILLFSIIGIMIYFIIKKKS